MKININELFMNKICIIALKYGYYMLNVKLVFSKQ